MISVIAYSVFGCTQSDKGEQGDSSASETAATEGNGGVAKIYVPPQSQEDPLTIEEGAVVASDVAGSYLHLPQGVVPAGPAVHVTSADGAKYSEAGQLRLTLELDFGHALTAMDLTNLVVLYQVEDSNGDTVFGLIPRQDLTVTQDSVTFYLQGFGNYQAAILPELVTEEIVSEPTAVPILTAQAENSLPLITWAKPTGSFQAAGRSLTLNATYNPSQIAMLNCVAVLDENKSSPYDYGATAGTTPSYSFSITNDSAHTVYGFFECVDDNGRVTQSAWSNAIAVAAVPPPTWDATIGALDVYAGAPLAQTLNASGADTYALSSGAMDCDTAAGWSTAVSVNATTGVVSGVPTVVGQTCTITATATNAGGSISQTFAVTVWNDPGDICDTDDGTTCTVSSGKVLADLSLVRIDGNLTIANAGSISSNVDESIAIDVSGDIDINSGGSIAANLIRMRATNIDIQVGGIVSADELSTYVGTSYASDATLNGQGAPHGGIGGADFSSGTSAPAYGIASQPITRGAKGEAGTVGAGGNGGGALKLTASGNINIGGTISANGGVGGNGDSPGGGGSGGSLWIVADTVTGNGSMLALGGNGGDASISDSGAGGAGGRIAIYATTNSFISTPLASFGIGGNTSSNFGGDGSAGTVQSYALTALPEVLIFNSSSTSNGNLGGLSGADQQCQGQAAAAGLEGRWRAILGSGDVGAKERVAIAGTVYDRAGTEIADQFEDLWAGSLLSAVAVTETGVATTNNAWTGSASDGTRAASHCSNWTNSTSGGNGFTGDYTSTNGDWISATTATCDQLRSLYCVSQ